MKGILPWQGGKNVLSKTIINYINDIDHQCYIEPFAGSAHIFFRKEPTKTEVLNDINSDIVNLFRILQNHLDEFIRFFRWAICSREEFDRLLKQPPQLLTDIQRASRFYYLQKLCFGGKLVNRSFGVSTTSPPRLNILRIEEDLSQAHLRLSRVLIENLKWQDIVQRYDRVHSLFYFDPPYFGCEDQYGKNLFARSEYEEMTKRIKELKGKFLMSINDCPETRAMFCDFHIKRLQVTYSIGGSKQGRRKFPELLISSEKLK